MKQFTLIKTRYNHHVSMDLYHEFENRILERADWDSVDGVGSFAARVLRQFLKVFPVLILPIKSRRNLVAIGYQKEKFLPYFLMRPKSKTVWMFDAWEPFFADIERAVRTYRINLLCTASRQSATHFDSLGIPNFRSVWIPEAVDHKQYRFVPYAQRTTDVLQLGRRWNDYHDKIKSIESDLTYLYEKKRGQIIFPTRDGFLDGLANAKISICVPATITHPEITGKISTITNRFLQSMASRCLILGKQPDDMKYLFDYNPIVEIDESDPVGQIREILANYESYIPLIEKNFEVVKSQHNWQRRAAQLELEILKTR